MCYCSQGNLCEQVGVEKATATTTETHGVRTEKNMEKFFVKKFIN